MVALIEGKHGKQKSMEREGKVCVGGGGGELGAGLRGLPTCVYEHAGQTFETPLSK